MKIPLSLSANFGEIRSDHFHSGLDLKTEGAIGKEVIAAADGYVYLLLVSPVGFGKAIYLRHPSGYSTVYAHLDRYAPDIEGYVRAQQYSNKSFSVTIYPPEGRIKVTKGQLLGYSGNTGGSTGPHLHFEVRRSDGEKPVDPLKFSFGITDNLKPVIQKLVVYPVAPASTIEGRNEKVFLDVAGNDGFYTIPDNQEINISGPAGFGISCYDNISGMPGRFGISSIELFVDSTEWFRYEINEFSFYETRYLNAHIDYLSKVLSNTDIERAFVLPNDRLSLYKVKKNNGIVNFSDGRSRRITIIIKDTFGNKAELRVRTRSVPPPYGIARRSIDSSAVVMPYGRENVFEAEGIKLVLPAGSLYDTLHFRHSASRLPGNYLSPVHHVHNRFTPVHSHLKLSIRPDTGAVIFAGKLLIVQLTEKNGPVSAGGNYNGGYVTADVRAFGNYAVAVDTVPPVISANGFAQDADLTGKESVRLRIKDELSGIRSYTGIIDGKWALFEYDAKNDMLTCVFDPGRIAPRSKHHLELTVTDNCNNTSRFVSDFTW